MCFAQAMLIYVVFITYHSILFSRSRTFLAMVALALLTMGYKVRIPIGGTCAVLSQVVD